MSQKDSNGAVELEGMVSTLTVLCVKEDDAGAVERALRAKVETMPGFFQDAPVVFDLSAVDGQDDDDPPRTPASLSLEALVAMARSLGLVPVGIRNGRSSRRDEAARAGVGLLRGAGRPAKQPSESVEDAPAQVDTERRTPGDRRQASEAAEPGALTLRAPLRSGQVIYAERADAIVLASVNSGAELIADGNIHVYGALRGRALAGAHGDEGAQIFCQSLEADLVSIAGTYLRADELPEEFRGKPARMWLREGKLEVTSL